MARIRMFYFISALFLPKHKILLATIFSKAQRVVFINALKISGINLSLRGNKGYALLQFSFRMSFKIRKRKSTLKSQFAPWKKVECCFVYTLGRFKNY